MDVAIKLLSLVLIGTALVNVSDARNIDNTEDFDRQNKEIFDDEDVFDEEKIDNHDEEQNKLIVPNSNLVNDQNSGNIRHASTGSFFDKAVKMTKGHRIAAFTRWGKQYSVDFKFVPSAIETSWRNVFLVTSINRNSGSRGGRLPGIWIQKKNGKNQVLVESDVNGNGQYIYNKPEPALKKDKQIEITVSQKLCGEHYIYDILVNKKSVHAIINKQAAVYDDVKVYASSPWHSLQLGSMYDVKIETW